jgi:hypothetical protein
MESKLGKGAGMQAPSENTIRVARGVMADLDAGVALNDAVRKASAMLGISRAAVCHCLTVTQDYLASESV